MRITLVSDAWSPQVNGVVRTLSTVTDIATARGHRVQTITPDRFFSVPMPSYPEIRLAMTTRRTIAAKIAGFDPDAVHIATEGPLGWLARGWCLSNGVPFTTSFHTRFPDYVAARTGLSPRPFWRVLERFHRAASHVLVATPRLAAELAEHGLHHTRPWTRGVDLRLFTADRAPHPAFADMPRPIALHVGRVAVEKNIEAFLAADWPGSKVVVGDGPALENLMTRYPQAHFLGALHGDALASTYAGADVLAFPSCTDTLPVVRRLRAFRCQGRSTFWAAMRWEPRGRCGRGSAASMTIWRWRCRRLCGRGAAIAPPMVHGSAGNDHATSSSRRSPRSTCH
jgi:glycosyltransferase involved in cell wall biosynthesis